MPTLLAIGAHYDDCVFGIPGILLQAVRKHHRVVILSLIGDYTNWPPVQGREPQLLEVTKQLAQERGMEMRFLKHASMHFRLGEDTQREVAEIVGLVVGPGGGHARTADPGRMRKHGVRRPSRRVAPSRRSTSG